MQTKDVQSKEIETNNHSLHFGFFDKMMSYYYSKQSVRKRVIYRFSLARKFQLRNYNELTNPNW